MASHSKPHILVAATQKPQEDTPELSDSIESLQATPMEETAEDILEPVYSMESSQVVLQEELAKSGGHRPFQ